MTLVTELELPQINTLRERPRELAPNVAEETLRDEPITAWHAVRIYGLDSLPLRFVR
ncbi:MAG: hypothetical protein ACRDLT_04815 [Solirubrobacteraceae bacterium]